MHQSKKKVIIHLAYVKSYHKYRIFANSLLRERNMLQWRRVKEKMLQNSGAPELKVIDNDSLLLNSFIILF